MAEVKRQKDNQPAPADQASNDGRSAEEPAEGADDMPRPQPGSPRTHRDDRDR